MNEIEILACLSWIIIITAVVFSVSSRRITPRQWRIPSHEIPGASPNVRTVPTVPSSLFQPAQPSDCHQNRPPPLPPLSLCLCLSVCLSVSLCLCLSLFFSLSVSLSVCLSVWLSVYTFYFICSVLVTSVERLLIMCLFISIFCKEPIIIRIHAAMQLRLAHLHFSLRSLSSGDGACNSSLTYNLASKPVCIRTQANYWSKHWLVLCVLGADPLPCTLVIR